MKKKSRQILPAELREEDIRDYAYHLFEQSGRIPGRDQENWLEARACLMANIPMHQSHMRLHEHMNGTGKATAPEHHVAA